MVEETTFKPPPRGKLPESPHGPSKAAGEIIARVMAPQGGA
jgi:hypothetical protein